MYASRRQFLGGAGVAMAALLSACGSQGDASGAESNASASASSQASSVAASSFSLTIDSSAWQYNADDDVYYQLNVTY